MLIKFKTTASYPEITMFGEIGLRLIKMMEAAAREDVPVMWE
jgi:hypothetical protein